jgi:hypothetical protein
LWLHRYDTTPRFKQSRRSIAYIGPDIKDQITIAKQVSVKADTLPVSLGPFLLHTKPLGKTSWHQLTHYSSNQHNLLNG